MKKRNRMMLGILLVVLSLSVTPKAAFAENKTVTVIEVGNEKAFDDAINTVNSASEGEYVISLTDNVEIDDASIQTKRPVTLLGNGHTPDGCPVCFYSRGKRSASEAWLGR